MSLGNEVVTVRCLVGVVVICLWVGVMVSGNGRCCGGRLFFRVERK